MSHALIAKSGASKLFRVVAVAVIGASIALGLWFRFTALDTKYFWIDEVHAALLRGGHSEWDLIELFDGRPRSLEEMRRFTEVDPTRPYSETPLTLARYHPVHPPLYYCALRTWTTLFGDSIAATRALSVAFSLLCFPAVYWLGRELFQSRAAAWTAVALWSVSPLEVLYAQEAKQYSLFAATILLSAAALLRAVRRPSFATWTWFAASVSLGVYTHLFFIPALAAFTGAIVLSRVGRFRSQRTWNLLKGYFAAVTFGLATYIPWAIVCLQVGDGGEAIARDHMSRPQPFAWLGAAWISNIGCVFSDLGYPQSGAAAILHVSLWLGVWGLAAYSLVYAVRHRPRHIWMMLVLLTILPALVLIVPDLVLGGGRSMLVRYWMASSIAILAAVAGALGRQAATAGGPRSFASAAILTGLLVLGTVSCLRSSQADNWWNKSGVVNNHRNAAFEHAALMRGLSIVERAKDPLIVTELGSFQECELLGFSYYLHNPQVQWLGTRNAAEISLPSDRTIFLYDSPLVAKHLRDQGWKLTLLDPQGLFVYAQQGPAIAVVEEKQTPVQQERLARD